MVTLIVTPYPDVFVDQPVPRIMVRALPDILVIIRLLELTDNLVKGLRVRCGLTHGRYIRNVVNFSSGIGLLLVRGLDLSERFYGVLNVRGYSGRISGGGRHEKTGVNDFAAIVIGVLIFGAALVIKKNGELSVYDGCMLALSLAALILSVHTSFFRTRGESLEEI
jgi:energy-coupling factor transporter transmembrane protein EcfT